MRLVSKYLALACVTVVGLAFVSQSNAGLVGLWQFEDGGDLTAATLVGGPLALTGSDTAVAGPGGPDNGAASLGVGDFYTANNSIGANGGGTLTNQYTILMDIKDSSTGFNALLDMDLGGDGDLFINDDGGVGISGEYAGVVNDGEWRRVVAVYDLGSAGPLTIYIDGVLAQTISSGDISGGGVVDGRFALQNTFTVFSDNGGGEEFTTSISTLALFDSALGSGAVVSLGGAGRVIPEPSTMALIVLFGLGLSVTSKRRR